MLRVLLSSSWNVRCGIAVFTKRLRDGLRDAGHESTVVNITALEEDFVSFATEYKPDILHIEYEPSMLQEELLAFKLGKVRKLTGAKTVVTLHYATQEMMQRLESVVDKFIVHRHYWLNKKDDYKHTTFIPMPCPVMGETPAPVMLRVQFGIPVDKTVLTTFGFLAKWKQTDTAIESLCKHIQERKENVFLQVLTSSHFWSTYDSEVMLNHIKESLKKHNIPGFVTSEFLRDSEIVQRFVLSDLGFLYAPIHTAGNSAAGLEFLAGCLPVVVTQSDHFATLDDSTCVRTPFSPDEFAKNVLDISKDTGRIRTMREACTRMYQERNFSTFVAAHNTLYSYLKEGATCV